MLLRQIAEHVFGGRDDLIVVFPESGPPSGDGRTFSFPAEALPAGKRFQLEWGEGFLTGLKMLLDEHPSGPVFLLPPWISHRRLSDSLRALHPRRALEEIALLETARSVSDAVEVFAVMPGYFFTRASSAQHELFELGAPELVVTLDGGGRSLGWHSSVSLGALVWQRGGRAMPLRFFRPPRGEYASDHVLRDLANLLKRSDGSSQYGYVLRQSVSRDQALNHAAFSPEHQEMLERVSSFGEARPLGELADICPGPLHRARDRDRLHESPVNSSVPVVEARMIGRDGEIDWDGCRSWAIVRDEQLLSDGDICVRALNSGALRAVQILSDAPRATYDQTVVRVRLREPSATLDGSVLAAYLGSQLGSKLLALNCSTMGDVFRVTTAALSMLPVPVFMPSLRRALQDIRVAENGFQSWLRELHGAEHLLFDHVAAKSDHSGMLDLARTARLRYRAGEMADDLSHRIRTLLPHPLAFNWRTVEASGPSTEGYERLLDCAESTLAYLAAITFVVLRDGGHSLAWIPEMARRVSHERRGTTMGDWVAILRAANQSNEARQLQQLAVPEVTTFLPREGDADAATQRLKDARDDRAHGRGPKGTAAIKSAFAAGMADLKSIFASIEFLADYPLTYVETCEPDTLEECTRYTYRDLTGDHPLVPARRGTRSSLELLEVGSLYVAGSAGQMLLLRPILSFRECPECGKASTFFLDRIDRKSDELFIKSLEHGHATPAPELVVPFKKVGWLA